MIADYAILPLDQNQRLKDFLEKSVEETAMETLEKQMVEIQVETQVETQMKPLVETVPPVQVNSYDRQ